MSTCSFTKAGSISPEAKSDLTNAAIGSILGALVMGGSKALSNDDDDDDDHPILRAALTGAVGGGAVGYGVPAALRLLGSAGEHPDSPSTATAKLKDLYSRLDIKGSASDAWKWLAGAMGLGDSIGLIRRVRSASKNSVVPGTSTWKNWKANYNNVARNSTSLFPSFLNLDGHLYAAGGHKNITRFGKGGKPVTITVPTRSAGKNILATLLLKRFAPLLGTYIAGQYMTPDAK